MCDAGSTHSRGVFLSTKSRQSHEIRRFSDVGFRHRGLVGEAQGAREIRAHAWAERLAEGLRRAGKTAAAAQGDRKSAPWKVALAAELKRETQVPNRWLAGRATAHGQRHGRQPIRQPVAAHLHDTKLKSYNLTFLITFSDYFGPTLCYCASSRAASA